jgi:hypothetical protein
LAFGPVSDSTISQVITDKFGTPYDLSYWLLVPPAAARSFSDVNVYWDGNLVSSVANPLPQEAWTEYSVQVTGTGSDSLKFGLADAPAYAALDDISVAAANVPDGGTGFWFMAGTLSGVCGAGFVYRRRVSTRA